MRPSTLQLLKVEQVVFAYKLIDVNKLYVLFTRLFETV